MDYLKHWSLHSNPFGRCAEVGFFAGTPQREVIARFHCLVSGAMVGGLLMAEDGCGQTSLLRHLSQSTGFGDTAVQMIMTAGQVDSPDVPWQRIAHQLRLQTTPSKVPGKVIDQIRSLGRQGVRTVWMIDDCDRQTAEVAGELIRRESDLTIVLGVNGESARDCCLALGQVPLRMELPPFSLEDSCRYVRWAMESVVAGGRASEHSLPFTDTALVRLHELGEGRIGWIGRVAELALMIGSAHQLQKIDVALLESVQSELVRAA
ncbi:MULTISPECIES: hypothetical protein [Crateriforma]|uniref:AAA+ ATPase domain-containing protein n=1 Tax=Crateriforma conspicua TaxID=2527996 RepID=A0A5C6FS77_9PLAN|nr:MULTISPECIES: hypothetical protein [Crateriforma]TWU65779.1 hypothetical protein V7x_13280 [Crateriforma conspicua]